MMRYAVQPRDQKFVWGYEFLSFAKIMDKNIVKKISKNLIWEKSQTSFDHTKQSATDTLTTASKRAIQKAAETAGDLFGSKIADLIFKTSQQNNSETVQMSMIKKYLKKDIYLQKKDITLLMIWD